MIASERQRARLRDAVARSRLEAGAESRARAETAPRPLRAETAAIAGYRRPDDRPLTDRQVQVVRLIAAGFTNREIADVMGTAARTAKAHSDVLRWRLGCRRRREIPLAFMRATGIDPFPRLEEAS